MTPKLTTRIDLLSARPTLKAAGKSVVFTSGVFDLLHAGHVRYLEAARKLGDVLVVGVNSDQSVRANKGELRPIVPASERAEIIAALGCVSHVFVFDELNNNENILLLQPDIYVKAGDYTPSKLSSAPIVESYGGKIAFVPFENGKSSSGIVETVVSRYGGTSQGGPDPVRTLAPAIFVDRDGTINQHVDFLSKPDQLVLFPGVIDALKKLKVLGFRIIVVTNQPGIGLGYLTREDFYAVNRKFLKSCSSAGLFIDKVYFCPHAESEPCGCRKPDTGMIERACKEMPIDLTRSFVIGDTTIDMRLAQNAGIPGVLVTTGQAGKDARFEVTAAYEARDLSDAANWIATVTSTTSVR